MNDDQKKNTKPKSKNVQKRYPLNITNDKSCEDIITEMNQKYPHIKIKVPDLINLAVSKHYSTLTPKLEQELHELFFDEVAALEAAFIEAKRRKSIGEKVNISEILPVIKKAKPKKETKKKVSKLTEEKPSEPSETNGKPLTAVS